MPQPRQRQWRSQNQHLGLHEYNLLKQTCPPGIYLTPTPSNFSLWSGVIFIHTSPYAPAILRFQISLPQSYPAVPPLIQFTSDIFHPLITPLTTHTYSTATPASATVSSGDDERLLPGSFSLRHGFPKWFDRALSGTTQSQTEVMFQDIAIRREADQRRGHRRPLSFHIPPPKDDAVMEEDDIPPSITEVMYYLKQVFEDEKLLDDLPLDVAANTGAWYAWQAHRRRTHKSSTPVRVQESTPTHGRSKSLQISSPSPATPVRPQQRQQKKSMADWNWDGVWLERVKRGISMSLSDAVLFGTGDGDDLIHFLDVDDEEYAAMKDDLLQQGSRQ